MSKRIIGRKNAVRRQYWHSSSTEYSRTIPKCAKLAVGVPSKQIVFESDKAVESGFSEVWVRVSGDGIAQRKAHNSRWRTSVLLRRRPLPCESPSLFSSRVCCSAYNRPLRQKRTLVTIATKSTSPSSKARLTDQRNALTAMSAQTAGTAADLTRWIAECVMATSSPSKP